MGAKVLSIKQMKAKKYSFLPDIPDIIRQSFGMLTKNFIMIIYGASGNGKSNLIMTILKILIKHGRILYVAYEEGHEVSMHLTIMRQLAGEEAGICFADHTMTLEELKKRLKKKRSEQFIVIDSVQYMRIKTEDYFNLKESFTNKTFIFISHADGKKPRGTLAVDIEYDATVKVRVEGFVAFIKSRLEGNEPYLIWGEGAKKYWGDKKFKEIFKIKKGNTKKATAAEAPKNIEEPRHAEVNEKIDTDIATV
jgi:ABC-type dipeptide/oligopeptide/nickel transport system ATPase component